MRVVIADDEPLARERLRSLLAAQEGVDVVAEAGNGEQALHACAALQPDLVLLDIAMPGWMAWKRPPPGQLRTAAGGGVLHRV